MTTKPPTPQGISALLRKAGFTRSESSSTAVKGWRHYGRGYVVRGQQPGVVTVRHEDGKFRPTDEDRKQSADMEAQYADAIRAAGYAVEVRDGGFFGAMIVTAPEPGPGEG